ncbi:hypothetical protein SAMN05444172_9202 [Burkholderia sp. GAS332]|nr:hypothetical protein SAMN05444172_9202 [Burkholderia sp. GAS332]
MHAKFDPPLRPTPGSACEELVHFLPVTAIYIEIRMIRRFAVLESCITDRVRFPKHGLPIIYLGGDKVCFPM